MASCSQHGIGGPEEPTRDWSCHMEMVRVLLARVTFKYILEVLQQSPLNSLALSPCLFFSKEKYQEPKEIRGEKYMVKSDIRPHGG